MDSNACNSHISRLDGQLDRLQLLKPPTASTSPELYSASNVTFNSESNAIGDESDLARVLKLQVIAQALSTASSARAILPASKILSSLEAADLLEFKTNDSEDNGVNAAQEHELEWLVVSKATAQTFGLILDTLLDQTIPLSSEIAYWDEVLGSYRYTSLYTIQTSPLRLWAWASDVYRDAGQRLRSMRSSNKEKGRAESMSVSGRWRQFYGLVRDSVRARSLADMQSKVFSPLTKSRLEARTKRSRLRRLHEMTASGLGILMDEGMIFDVNDEDSISSRDRSGNGDEWRSVVSKSISLMETVLGNMTALELGTGELEETVFQGVEDDAESTQPGPISSQTIRLAVRLDNILSRGLPAHIAATSDLSREYGRPSRLIRYWLPGFALFLSSSTLLRIFVNRRAQIITWIQDLGTTTIDFWNNWVVEPVKKVIGTIRHDKDSEFAIMSKDSLQGDRASLERMVVDFATDNPNTPTGAPLTEAEIAGVRAKVKEGDLTPVLRAYEKDLQKPFVGTIRGDLIRALLIQIQKTKVDVEVAVGGIDNLLKSQELVFGFVGLTPGVLVCLGLSRWLSGVFAGRKGRIQGSKQGSLVRVLRNIDRILISSTPSGNGVLSYKDHGMLLCEAHVLRQKARPILPGEIYNDFLEEIHDLVDLRTGIDRQMHIVARIRWAYSRWL